jgi:integrase/recombinase XerC
MTRLTSQLVNDYVAAKVNRKERDAASARALRRDLLQLVAYIESCCPSDLSEANVSAWLGNPEWAESTVAGKLSGARGWTAWLTRHGHVQTDPCVTMRGPRVPRKVPRIAALADVARLFAACRSPVERLLVSLLVQEGLRVEEVAELQWEQFDSTDRVVAVRGRARNERPVPISTATYDLMRIVGLKDRGPVIERPRSQAPMTRPTVSQWVGRIARRAGVKLNARTLRATAATDMLEHGAHLRDVQMILGHARIRTTSRYLRARWATMRGAIDGRRYDTEPPVWPIAFSAPWPSRDDNEPRLVELLPETSLGEC